MSAERLEELLWSRVDGALDGEEEEELRALLAVQPDAGRLEREVDRLAQRLNRLPRVAAPPELRGRIDRALAAARPDLTADTAPRLSRFRPTVRWRDRLLPLAAGLVLGAAITLLLSPGAGRGVEGSRAVGSMPATPVERSVEVDLGGEVGSVRLIAADGTLVAELRLVGDAGVTLALDSGAGELRLVAAEHVGGTESSVAAGDGRVVLRARGPGTNRLSVAAPEAVRRVRLEVTTATGAVVERWIDRGLGGEPP